MKFLTLGQKLGRPECPYMKRWVINFGYFSLRLHHWYSSDDPRHKHNHPWWYITFVLKGSYNDLTEEGRRLMGIGTIAYFPASHSHTVEVNPGGCWTFIITGPQVKKWGFWVNGKFKKANKYFLEHGHHQCE